MTDNKGNREMGESDYVKLIAQRLETIDSRLAEHITTDGARLACVMGKLTTMEKTMASSKEVGEIKNQITGHKIKIGIMFTTLGLAMLGMWNWVLDHLDEIT